MAVPERVVLGRRAALLGGVGGLAALVAACRSVEPAPAGTPSTPGPTEAGTTTPGAAPSPEPSSALAETADRTRVRTALDKTEVMLAGLLSLRRAADARALVALHTTHRSTLLDLLDETESPLPEPGDPPLTRAEVPLREAALQAELVSAALGAEDGSVSRMLASMSAGIAQQLALLPSARPPRPGTSPTPAGTAT